MANYEYGNVNSLEVRTWEFASEVRLWNNARTPMARDPRKPVTSRVFSSLVQAPWADSNCADRSVRLTETYQIEHVHILQIDPEGMDYDVLNWFFDADVQPAMINFENLHLGRRERSASRELLRTNGYWWIETSQDTFANKQSWAGP